MITKELTQQDVQAIIEAIREADLTIGNLHAFITNDHSTLPFAQQLAANSPFMDREQLFRSLTSVRQRLADSLEKLTSQVESRS